MKISKLLLIVPLVLAFSACTFRHGADKQRTVDVQKPYVVTDETNKQYNERIFRENTRENELDLRTRKESDRAAKLAKQESDRVERLNRHTNKGL